MIYYFLIVETGFFSFLVEVIMLDWPIQIIFKPATFSKVRLFSKVNSRKNN